MLAHCSKDIVIAPPAHRPILGLDQARDFFQASSAPIEEIKINEYDLQIHSGLAIKRARFTTRLCGASRPIVGWHVWMLRPKWKISYLTWSIDE